eukprot:TRINITY_DN1617_c0_g1_i3.p2 TRINITY_DN1617_c0_g1~~TRINITY_DN1617_c0_g1_i3.p2  ORF type:complete len:329 (+),score=76.92 TRINITY_DN1617_c0_g1_i3:85-1071(+)
MEWAMEAPARLGVEESVAVATLGLWGSVLLLHPPWGRQTFAALPFVGTFAWCSTRMRLFLRMLKVAASVTTWLAAEWMPSALALDPECPWQRVGAAAAAALLVQDVTDSFGVGAVITGIIAWFSQYFPIPAPEWASKLFRGLLMLAAFVVGGVTNIFFRHILVPFYDWAYTVINPLAGGAAVALAAFRAGAVETRGGLFLGVALGLCALLAQFFGGGRAQQAPHGSALKPPSVHPCAHAQVQWAVPGTHRRGNMERDPPAVPTQSSVLHDYSGPRTAPDRMPFGGLLKWLRAAAVEFDDMPETITDGWECCFNMNLGARCDICDRDRP